MHRATERTANPKYNLLSRRNTLRLMTAGVIGSLTDAFWIEPDSLSITRQDVTCHQLPAGLDGLRIAVLADFHYRPQQDAGLIDTLVTRIREEKPDLIALAGDFMDKNPRVLPPLLEQLERMNPAHGIFAVMGNHDGWNDNPATIRRRFEQSGISFLINQNSHLSIRGETLAITGTDFVWRGKPDPDRALRGIAAKTPVLALVHEPDYFDNMTARREILLQVSGHTHGGQCRVPLLGYPPVKVKYGEKYVAGHYPLGKSNLFVTRGVGTTGPRVRFACPPELAMLTLRPARTDS